MTINSEFFEEVRKILSAKLSYGMKADLDLEDIIVGLLRDLTNIGEEVFFEVLKSRPWNFLKAVEEQMQKKEKVQAIKILRANTGMGLKASKEFVEAMQFPLLPYDEDTSE